MSTLQVDLNNPANKFRNWLTLISDTKTTWRNPINFSIVFDNKMTGVCGLKVFIGAVVEEKVRSPEIAGSEPDVLLVIWLWLSGWLVITDYPSPWCCCSQKYSTSCRRPSKSDQATRWRSWFDFSHLNLWFAANWKQRTDHLSSDPNFTYKIPNSRGTLSFSEATGLSRGS